MELSSQPPRTLSGGGGARIRDAVKSECAYRLASSTLSVFRTFQRGEHERYARLFVDEVARRLDVLPQTLSEREDCLWGVVLCFTRAVDMYRATTTLHMEIGIIVADKAEKELR